MRRSSPVVVAVLVIVSMTALTVRGVATAQPAADVPAEPWQAGLAFPTNMAASDDGRLFFTEKATGAVRVVSADGVLDPSPVLTLGVSSTGETGLLGIALHPDFTRGSPWLYLYLSDPADGMNRLVRARVGDDGRASAPEPLLTTVPATAAYHNGGDLLIGPDRMLYVAVGEAHEPARAQDLDDVGGKVLRLDLAGGPAPGNPLGDANPVFTSGHRNSFGLCADPATGDLWETENGPDVDDEVNRLAAGANYGWPDVTGDSGGRFADPVAVFPTTVALTGCAWWQGELLVGAWNDGRVRRIDTETGETSEEFAFPAGVTDILVGRDGALYVATADAIWRLGLPGSPVAPTASTSLGPDPMPPADDTGDRRIGWVALVAAVVLAAGLVARVAAGRALRSAEDDAPG
jgi:glucose/arabinose dehydrogenase